MNQKIITVPKDQEAEKALDIDTATPDQLIEIKLGEKTFQDLWQQGIFTLINNVASSNIDDFEDERITDEDAIKNVIAVLKTKEESVDGELKSVISEIIDLFTEALNRKTGIYFYF